ncbi:hypothetical protein NQ318_005617 [Aromia moschata]|uniref:Gamma tubulin complex component protein N-terminal domain-containing protein n=1 Tax=Aromia moschata TaxID=1265417 RepID=A0AAV8XX02_9CUCU|nr:hypothetical protein NQ318_005617 [Aromia moschata]
MEKGWFQDRMNKQGCKENTEMTLKRALYVMHEHHSRFEWLAYIAEQCSDKKGGALITAIHGFLQHGSKCAQEADHSSDPVKCCPLDATKGEWITMNRDIDQQILTEVKQRRHCCSLSDWSIVRFLSLVFVYNCCAGRPTPRTPSEGLPDHHINDIFFFTTENRARKRAKNCVLLDVSEGVLKAVCKPLYIMLSRWLLDGEINDPCNEFFIESKTIITAERLWHDKYYVRQSMVPSFITMDQAKKILATGKSINFLRQICKDGGGQLSGRESFHKLFKTTSVPMRDTRWRCSPLSIAVIVVEEVLKHEKVEVMIAT